MADDVIDGFKVDELKLELDKRGLSKSGLKAELRERLKKAVVDKIPVMDAEKISAGPSGFDVGCKWRLIDPTSPAVEPKECEDPSLLDPSSAKYQVIRKNQTENEVKKVTKMDYEKNSYERNLMPNAYNLPNH